VKKNAGDLLWALYKEGEQAPGGWVHAAAVMGRMDLRTSGLLELAHKPSTVDDLVFKRLAQNCKGRRLIKSDDRYQWVRITEKGKRYLGVQPASRRS
jgi:hypothetical protein